MTLARQLLLIISLMFLLIFLGTLAITADNTRRYLITQLGSHAQDTATSLGLSLSPHMATKDTLLMESMVDAIFDRGYYREIVVEDIDKNPLIERRLAVKVHGVPAWFVGNMPLVTPRASARLMAGWRQGAQINVVSHPGHAYEQLWLNTVQTFWWSVGSLVVAIVLTTYVLRFILAPLGEMEAQARAVADREFPRVEKIPRTRELKRVVLAMNRMTGKVEEMLAEHHRRVERIRAATYVDVVTGMGNKVAFERDLERMVTHREEHAFGALAYISIAGLEEANREHGYDGGNEFLRDCAARIAMVVNDADGSTGRLAGALFAVLLPNAARSSLPVTMQALVDSLGSAEGTEPAADVVHIGLAYYGGGQTAEVLKERAESAQRSPTSNWHLYVATETAAGRDVQHEDRWRQILRDVLDRRDVVLAFQVVKTADLNEVIHHEVLARIRSGDGELVAAGVFFPMAARVGLTVEFDRLIVELAVEHIGKTASAGYAINLSRQAVGDADFVGWLVKLLEQHPTVSSRLAFEVTEQLAVGSPELVIALARKLRERGAMFGVDHCGARDIALEYMKQLKPHYSKVDGAFITGLHDDQEKQAYVRSLVEFGRAFDIRSRVCENASCGILIKHPVMWKRHEEIHRRRVTNPEYIVPRSP